MEGHSVAGGEGDEPSRPKLDKSRHNLMLTFRTISFHIRAISSLPKMISLCIESKFSEMGLNCLGFRAQQPI